MEAPTIISPAGAFACQAVRWPALTVLPTVQISMPPPPTAGLGQIWPLAIPGAEAASPKTLFPNGLQALTVSFAAARLGR